MVEGPKGDVRPKETRRLPNAASTRSKATKETGSLWRKLRPEDPYESLAENEPQFNYRPISGWWGNDWVLNDSLDEEFPES